VSNLVANANAGSVSAYVNNVEGARLSGNDVVAPGTKNFIAPHPLDEDKVIVYAAAEGPEAKVFVRGQAELRGGRAVVRLPEHFRLSVERAGMSVQLTPGSAQSKGLAATAISPTELTVAELGSGEGDYTFFWEVSAVRKRLRGLPARPSRRGVRGRQTVHAHPVGRAEPAVRSNAGHPAA